MPAAYREQITKTFRDNAIRSVLFIDDEYLPYPVLSLKQKALLDELSTLAPKLLDGEVAPTVADDADEAKALLAETLAKMERLRDLASVGQDSFKRTKVAEEFVKFFHKEKYICDVENQTNDLQSDKIRKSDLIILDYCLVSDDASKSLKLLKELSFSKHLNLVVIYTNKPLTRVWQQIAATLRSPKPLDIAEFFSGDEASLEMLRQSSELFERCWDNTSRNNQVDFILGNEQLVVDRLKDDFWQVIQDDEDYDDEAEPTDGIIRYLIEKDIRLSHLLTGGEGSLQIHGKDELWIQCGEIFIALCKKEGDDDAEIALQPKAVWDKLNEALHDWYPSFYRVVLSELQNRIEDSNFTMSKVLAKPHHEQISLLWSILKEHREGQLDVSEELLRYLLEDISDDLINRDDKSAPRFISEVANSVAEEPPEYVAFKRSAPQPYKDFLKEATRVSKENFKDNAEVFDTDFCLNIAHAYNEQVSTMRNIPTYITTGMILKSVKRGKTRWYMCVTPSCDTVPEQKQADNASQLDPHRLLKFAKLTEVSLAYALANAYQSSYLFISDGAKRIALSVIDSESKQPDLVKLVIVNHNHNDLDYNGKNALKLKNQNEGIKTEQLSMKPIAQLEAHYAARYQAVQSHHEGRIGVDFITADFRDEPKPEPVEEA